MGHIRIFLGTVYLWHAGKDGAVRYRYKWSTASKRKFIKSNDRKRSRIHTVRKYCGFCHLSNFFHEAMVCVWWSTCGGLFIVLIGNWRGGSLFLNLFFQLRKCTSLFPMTSCKFTPLRNLVRLNDCRLQTMVYFFLFHEFVVKCSPSLTAML